MSGRLSGKVAIVTGASSGLGRAISLAFAHEGAKLVCADIVERAKAEGTAKTVSTGAQPEAPEGATHEIIQGKGGQAIFVKTDVGSSDQVEALVEKAVQEYGRLDIMVNNAGIAIEVCYLPSIEDKEIVAANRALDKASDPKPIWEVEESTWDKTLLINGKSVFLGCKFASRQMIKQDPHPNGDRGWIINTASILGLVGTINTASYGASKGAVVRLTQCVALDCAPHRIHCNALCPGYTRTAMTGPIFEDPQVRGQLLALHPFRGLGEPEDLARVAVFLASEDAGWVTGIALPVDGGYTAM